MSQAYVPSCLLASLAALGVGHVGASSHFGQAGCIKALRVSARLRQREGHIHEDQFCERRPCSRVDRLANEPVHRSAYAAFQGQFVTLGQRAEFGRGQIRLGPWLRRVLRFGIGCCGSGELHRETGRTSPEKGFYRGIETVCRALRTGMARGLKPLKRFQYSSRLSCTSLKRGVNEKSPAR